MPWGWECRAKLIKQLPSKPTERRGPVSGAVQAPASNHYEVPQLYCSKGFSNIKRAPAYTFGHVTPTSLAKPAVAPNAPMFNVRGQNRQGCFKITHGVVSPQINSPRSNTKVPGPGTHAPQTSLRYKRAPAYSVRQAARPPYQPWDMWTPPPNMYCPAMPLKKTPEYTLGYMTRESKIVYPMPGPGEHEPKFNYTKKTPPGFSFGRPFKPLLPPNIPPPNAYCEKKLMFSKRTIPAFTFGIRHTPYLGKQEEYLKSRKHNLLDNIS